MKISIYLNHSAGRQSLADVQRRTRGRATNKTRRAYLEKSSRIRVDGGDEEVGVHWEGQGSFEVGQRKSIFLQALPEDLYLKFVSEKSCELSVMTSKKGAIEQDDVSAFPSSTSRCSL